jgi:hypothetical protein
LRLTTRPPRHRDPLLSYLGNFNDGARFGRARGGPRMRVLNLVKLRPLGGVNTGSRMKTYHSTSAESGASPFHSNRKMFRLAPDAEVCLGPNVSGMLWNVPVWRWWWMDAGTRAVTSTIAAIPLHVEARIWHWSGRFRGGCNPAPLSDPTLDAAPWAPPRSQSVSFRPRPCGTGPWADPLRVRRPDRALALSLDRLGAGRLPHGVARGIGMPVPLGGATSRKARLSRPL